jgi:hypothetical protein
LWQDDDPATGRPPIKKDRSKLPDQLDEAARPDEDHATQERNAGLAIAVLALVVVALLLAIVVGATDAFRP